jgi:hypothetical protein
MMRIQLKTERTWEEGLIALSMKAFGSVSLIESAKKGYSIWPSRQSHSFVEQSSYDQLRSRLLSYRKLNSNWDSYNAVSTSLVSIAVALKVLDALDDAELLDQSVSIFPMRDGGIQFEFDRDDSSSELEISSAGELKFLEFDDEGNVQNTSEIYLSALNELVALIPEAKYA